MSLTARTIVTDALKDLGAIGLADTPSPSDAQYALSKLNRLIDLWNAQREAIYADNFPTFTLTPSLNPHTIGPTGATWTVDQRPVSIEGIQLRISSTDTLPLWPRDAAWWQGLPAPGLSSAYPTDYYYDPTWSNGKVYFYPVPSSALTVQLQVRAVLGEYTLDTVFTMPPGYRDAITKTLVEECDGLGAAVVSPKQSLAASRARAVIFGNNLVVPKLTSPAGLPTGRTGYFDYQTGQSR